jgi:hypothetical protein
LRQVVSSDRAEVDSVRDSPKAQAGMSRFQRGGRALRKAPGEMNKTEEAYSKHLDLQVKAGLLISHQFDALKLRLADKTFYTPDFFVVNARYLIEIHEVKGFWEEDARIKIKVAAALFPFVFKAAVWDRKTKQWVIEEFSEIEPDTGEWIDAATYKGRN